VFLLIGKLDATEEVAYTVKILDEQRSMTHLTVRLTRVSSTGPPVGFAPPTEITIRRRSERKRVSYRLVSSVASLRSNKTATMDIGCATLPYPMRPADDEGRSAK
jgi:hypothetical protein